MLRAAKCPAELQLRMRAARRCVLLVAAALARMVRGWRERRDSDGALCRHVCGADDRVYWTGFFGKTDGGSDDGVAGVSLDRSQPQPEPTPSPPSGGAGSGGGACGDPMVKEMVAYDNKARAENGRAALECDNMLAGIALRWSKGQCADKRISHDGMNGRCEEIYDQGFNACAENVAYNWPPKLDTTTYDTHVDWMNSPGHRKNILKEDLTHVGYGWYVCAALPGEQDRVYWTGFFGRK
eukprot:jgi/Ulvmu1/2499/UM138_0003.1